MSQFDPRDDKLLRLNAALDDELDAAHRLDLDREIAQDPHAAAALQRLSIVSDAVRRHAPREAAPASLRASVAALGSPRPAARRAYFPIGAALAAGLAIGVTGPLVPGPSRGGDPVMASLTGDFARAELSGHTYDIASSDRHVVKPWLATRAPLGVEAVDLADKGYPLAGGRVAVVGATPTADARLSAARTLDRGDRIAAIARQSGRHAASGNARRLPLAPLEGTASAAMSRSPISTAKNCRLLSPSFAPRPIGVNGSETH